jgi:hypothetical protein
MPTGRFQISAYTEGPKPDYYTNTLYFDINAGVGGDTDWAALAGDLATVWTTNATWQGGANRIRVRAYDLADAEPRQPKADVLRTITLAAIGCPAEVALCLSFQGAEARARQRGRIYCGPFTFSVADRPSATLRGQLIALAQAFADLGGVNVDWVVFSPTATLAAGGDVKTYSVQKAWVDDEWDTVRSRGRAATTRTNLALSE